MDRHSFLSSLPFLQAFRFTGAPRNNDTAGQATTTTTTSPLDLSQPQRVELSNHMLSIEPKDFSSPDSAGTVGVAYFGTVAATEDPAMVSCHVELSVQPQTAPSQLEQPQETAMTEKTLAALSLRIEQYIYMVDWTQLLRVTVKETTDKKNDDEPKHTTIASAGKASTGSRKPSSLLLEFSSCNLRLFVLPAARAKSSLADEEDCLSAYRTMKTLLVQLQRWNTRGSTRLALARMSLSSNAVVDSPAASTPTNSSSTHYGQAGESARSLTAEATTTESPDSVVDPVERRLQRKRKALQQCEQEVESLVTLLELPVEVAKSKSKTIGTEVFSLLTTIADDLTTASMSTDERPSEQTRRSNVGSDSEVWQVLQQRNDTRLQDIQNDLDQALTAFFPAPRRPGRSRAGSSRGGSVSGTGTPQKSAQETLETVEGLLKEQKAAIREAHGLLTGYYHKAAAPPQDL